MTLGSLAPFLKEPFVQDIVAMLLILPFMASVNGVPFLEA